MQVLPLFNPSASAVLSVPTATTTTVFTGAANANGAILQAASFVLQATVATAVQAALRTIAAAAPLLGGRIELGAVVALPMVLPGQVFIPAGIGLEFANTVSPANVILNVSYRLL